MSGRANPGRGRGGRRGRGNGSTFLPSQQARGSSSSSSTGPSTPVRQPQASSSAQPLANTVSSSSSAGSPPSTLVVSSSSGVSIPLGSWKPLTPGQQSLDISALVPGYFYRAGIVFPSSEVDEPSPLNHYKTTSGNPPVFKGRHVTTMGQHTGLYKFGYSRTVCVTNVSTNTVTVFVCSSSPRDPTNCINTHQPPQPVAVLPPGSLTQDRAKPVYMCFTHAIEVTPVLQG
ncbi:hypothetical protein K440DRAFT_240576 [Wilcoxina mikolae CBS 423.85]|nr:hypothetical protein K440DRAFT_240576 [Wilcoxina mikolae CBS 423.85]